MRFSTGSQHRNVTGKHRAKRMPRKSLSLLTCVVLVLATSVAITVTGVAVHGGRAAATTPGTPGTPQAGTTVYTESFSNQSAAAAPISILNYTGGPAALNSKYTADAPANGNPGW